MQIEITKNLMIGIGIVLLLALIGFFFYFRADNLDKKIDDLAVAMSEAKVNKSCQENNLSEADCKAMRDKINSNLDSNRHELLVGINKDCQAKLFSAEECNQYKQKFINDFRAEIDATAPFSEIEPELRTALEEAADKICKKQNQPDETCRLVKIGMLKSAQDYYQSVRKETAEQCQRLNAPEEKCKEVTAKILEDYKKDIMSKAKAIQ